MQRESSRYTHPPPTSSPGIKKGGSRSRKFGGFRWEVVSVLSRFQKLNERGRRGFLVEASSFGQIRVGYTIDRPEPTLPDLYPSYSPATEGEEEIATSADFFRPCLTQRQEQENILVHLNFWSPCTGSEIADGGGKAQQKLTPVRIVLPTHCHAHHDVSNLCGRFVVDHLPEPLSQHGADESVHIHAAELLLDQTIKAPHFVAFRSLSTLLVVTSARYSPLTNF